MVSQNHIESGVFIYAFRLILSCMAERLWSYPELKHVTVNQYKLGSEELAEEINRLYHKSEPVRSAADIEKIKKAKTIFNRGPGI
jgi:hypothetical protein